MKKILLLNIFALLFASVVNAAYTPPTPTLGAGSAYTIATTTAFNPYKFQMYEIGADSSLIPYYYKITKKSGLNLSPRINNPSGSTIGDINGEHFIGLFDSENKFGGAILNEGIIGNIRADFISNHLQSTSGFILGGAIYNSGTISSITGDFIDNYARFLSDGNAAGGAILNNDNSIIGSINSNFINNYVNINAGNGAGGAIFNNTNSKIGDITGNFMGNYVESLSENSSNSAVYNANGGAIFNNTNSKIGHITGNFEGNYAKAKTDGTNGGAIYNTNIIDGISGNFLSNYIHSQGGSGLSGFSRGGAIYNQGSTAKIGEIRGNFIDNYAKSVTRAVLGGAIFNNEGGNIGDIFGNFIDNYADAKTNAQGGAIYNNTKRNDGVSKIGNITGNFERNYAKSVNYTSLGGAIYIYGAGVEIGNITGYFKDNFVEGKYGKGGAILNSGGGTIGYIDASVGGFSGNYAKATTGSAQGGVIYNSVINTKIGNITGDFSNNYTISTDGYATSGAIYNYGQIGNITGNFINNSATSTGGNAYGGAIFNYDATIGEIAGSFTDNYAKGATTVLGGAIYTNNDLTFKADGKDNLFSGNYTQVGNAAKIYNAIFVDTEGQSANRKLVFNALNNGSFTFNDTISGGNYDFTTNLLNYDNQYDVSFIGNGRETSTFNLNNRIINAGEVLVDNTTLKLGKFTQADGTISNGGFVDALTNLPVNTSLTVNNSIVDLNTGTHRSLHLKNLTTNNAHFHLNIGKQGGVWLADVINVDKELSGNHKTTIFSLHDAPDIGESVLFLSAPNDTDQTNEISKIHRVFGSPYMWTTAQNINGEISGSNWYFQMDTTPNPDHPKSLKVAPEIIAFISLPMAGIEQTRNITNSISNKINLNNIYSSNCKGEDGLLLPYCYDKSKLYNLWVNPTYTRASVDTPIKMKSYIGGVEAGVDMQINVSNKLGIFGSYRNGDHNIERETEKYYSDIGSDIDIDSYIGGLYYQANLGNWWALATIFGGTQKSKIKTDDGVHANTDANQFGASFETGYAYNLTRSITLAPKVGVFNTTIDYNYLTDDVGKTAKYDMIRYVEVEAGLRLEKTLFSGFQQLARIYIEPSVIRTLGSGDNVNIVGLTSLSINTNYYDKTLGRIELGGNLNINNDFSTYGFTNYTFGDDYDAVNLGLGLSYKW